MYVRFIQKALSIRGDLSHTELPVATHTRATRADNMGPPDGITHPAVAKGVDPNAAINYRYEV